MFKKFFQQKPIVFFGLYALLATIATVQEYSAGLKKIGESLTAYTSYNNYVIFKYSFFHLIDKIDLYALHLDEHWDLYKYSPTFAFLFGSIAWMPDGFGLFTWNLLNAAALFFGVNMLQLENREKNIVLAFGAVELFTSLQNAQSNALIAGLIILAFALMEKEKFFWACVCIALTVYIKLFGVFAFAMCLLYRARWKMVLYSAVAMLLLALLPLLVINFEFFKSSYTNWWDLLQKDYIPNHLSLIGVIKAWTTISLQPNLVLLFGMILFLTPLSRIKSFDLPGFRMAFVAMILLWLLVFNHKAESPTFIIAIAGVGVWFVSSELEQRWKNVLIIFALIFTSLSTTDIFPDFIQDNVFTPLSIKAVPCIVIYFVLLYELNFRSAELKKL